MPSNESWIVRLMRNPALVQYAGMVGVLMLLIAIFSSLSEHFFRFQTIPLILNQIPDLIVIAVGMTLVLVIGGIDLSVGSLLALGSAVIGVLMVDHGWSFLPASIVCIVAAGLCGLINGLISVGAKIPSFIVTLGMLEIARGVAYLLTNSEQKYIGSSVETLSKPLPLIGLSSAFLIALVVVLVAQWVLTRTVFGRYCIAIGTNAETVRMSGVNTVPYSVIVFAVSGLLCGLAAIMRTTLLPSTDPETGVGIELAAIAACVIGGTSLMGGRGSVIHTFFGVLIISVLQTGLAQIGAAEGTKRIVTGSVIIVAVLLDAARGRWFARR